jgi:hypothetical protein
MEEECKRNSPYVNENIYSDRNKVQYWQLEKENL